LLVSRPDARNVTLSSNIEVTLDRRAKYSVTAFAVSILIGANFDAPPSIIEVKN